MELFEKINRAFGAWYEGLFGGSDDVRPRDILRRILVALEEHRKEGFDNKIYVPNQYILEIAVDDAEEKEYLLSFLDRDELETAIRRYCQQNHYHIRGALDFTIREVEPESEGKRREKVRVRCRYDSKLAAMKAEEGKDEGRRRRDESAPLPPSSFLLPPSDENPTVYEVGADGEMGTVPAIALARLEVHTSHKPPFEIPVGGALTIGRSAHAGNDLVLAEDGMVSRRHARIELDADGRFTLYDLDTTNGTRVNGRRIDNRLLHDGDEIIVGATHLIFHQEDPGNSRLATHDSRPSPTPRLILTDGARDVDDFILASETLLGRGVTNDVVLPDRSVATRHARLRRGDPCTLEALDAEGVTTLNGSPVAPGAPVPLRSGDRIGIGTLTLRFEEGQP
jgi:pSer/pThr/pTyr-binding forkhead associated (FHA) protein